MTANFSCRASRFAALSFFVLLTSTGLQGAVVTYFNFDTTEGVVGNAATLAPNSYAIGLSTTGFTFGAGSTSSANTNLAPGGTDNLNRLLNLTNSGATSETAARTNATYGQFSITVQAGYTLNLRNQAVTLLAAKGGGTGIRTFFLDVSLDNFTSYSTTGVPLSPASATAYENGSFTLPDTADYESLGSGSTITFRFYEFSPNNGQSVKLDDISINGTLVPEPSSMALLVAGGIAMGVRRRR